MKNENRKAISLDNTNCVLTVKLVVKHGNTGTTKPFIGLRPSPKAYKHALSLFMLYRIAYCFVSVLFSVTHT